MFLAKLDVKYVICGHSERRDLFGETDEMVAAKVTAIQKHGMTPIVCVGETLAEREAGATETKVLGQVDAAVAGRTKSQIAAMVVAYEPIWAIGTGRTATAEDAQAVCHADPRAHRPRSPTDATGDAVRIQYGGSVKASNIAELMARPTSTARWSAAPASTPTSSPASSPSAEWTPGNPGGTSAPTGRSRGRQVSHSVGTLLALLHPCGWGGRLGSAATSFTHLTSTSRNIRRTMT